MHSSGFPSTCFITHLPYRLTWHLINCRIIFFSLIQHDQPLQQLYIHGCFPCIHIFLKIYLLFIMLLALMLAIGLMQAAIMDKQNKATIHLEWSSCISYFHQLDAQVFCQRAYQKTCMLYYITFDLKECAQDRSFVSFVYPRCLLCVLTIWITNLRPSLVLLSNKITHFTYIMCLNGFSVWFLLLSEILKHIYSCSC